MANGWESLGNAIGGGNTLPNELAFEQGQSLGANTASALAEARARVVKNAAIANLDSSLRGVEPDDQKRAALVGQYMAGVDPTKTAQTQLDQFNLAQKQNIVDPNSTAGSVARSSLASGTGLPEITRAVGTDGNYTSALDTNPGVHISDLGQQIAQGSINKDAAQVAADNARAREANVNADNGGSHVPTGYAPMLDPTTGQPKIDPQTGRPVLVGQAGGPADINAPKPMGAVALRSVNRMLDSAMQSTQDIQNISAMPAGTQGAGLMDRAANTLGLTGYGATPQQKSLLDTAKGDLTNLAAPETVKAYTTLASGLSRSMASLEAAGMVPNGSFTDSFNKLQNVSGDTNYDALMKLAQMRQITENALNSMVVGNVSVPADRQKVANTVLDNMEKAVPFTVQDILKLHNDPTGSQTLSQIAGIQRPTVPTIAPGPGASHGKPAAAETPTPTATAAPAASSPANTVQMHDASGKIYAIPAGKVPDAKADGLQEL